MFLSACVGEVPTTHTSSPTFLYFIETSSLNHGQTGVSLCLFVVNLRLEPKGQTTLHQRQVLETGFSSLRSFIQHQDRAIEQQLSGCIILGVRPYFLISHFSVFPCVCFSTYSPNIAPL
jgi:hypothetical protein